MSRIACVAAALALAGCYVHAAGPGYGAEAGVGGDYYEVEGPPPPVQEETVVASPGPDYVWIGGYYDWDVSARNYAWRSGRWERPPDRDAHWVAPRHEMRNGRHYYTRGRWSHGGERRDRDH